ncbi:hypothetical protein EMPG_10613 [Blastomyces silverae]|uniref:Uncharacterized protein n=1 Tax=Blastomyces silverae TaxID=2060906 RepID=A0A0H1B4F9_9EURO|nr:hypothetical protein EMPG_10613 [Blastomyces silverae]
MLECDGGVASRQSKLGSRWEDAGNPKFHHNHSKVGTIDTTSCGKVDGYDAFTCAIQLHPSDNLGTTKANLLSSSTDFTSRDSLRRHTHEKSSKCSTSYLLSDLVDQPSLYLGASTMTKEILGSLSLLAPAFAKL